MTTRTLDDEREYKPNHMHLNGNPSFGFTFGTLHDIKPVHIPGEGHHDYVRVWFRYGLVLDLDCADAARLGRDLVSTLATIKHRGDGLS